MSQPLQITLDWRAYCEAFSEAHGGNPVPHGGRLLWADGWTYSATDHAGPEWPPPADPERLRRLQAAYWRERRRIVKLELDTLRATLDGLRGMEAARQVPLYHVVRVRDDETGKTVVRRGPLVLEEFRGRLEWLAEDLADCEKRLAGLESPQEAVTQ